MVEIMALAIPIIAVSIPIVAIVTHHKRKNALIQHKIILDQLELEKLKHENYLIETQKMRLELEKIQLENSKNEQKIL